jgi:NAD(P)-dependent dehydrogenase (short-subunit alcohol dehydrogenase family)
LNHFTRVLAAEELTLTVIALRPGVGDTKMQATMRREGPKIESIEQAAYYWALKEFSEIEHREVPARAIARLGLHRPRIFGGQLLDYDDAHIKPPVWEIFGKSLD